MTTRQSSAQPKATGGRAQLISVERRAFEETKHQLLAVVGHAALLSDPTAGLLQAKLALRTPYITPLNILQVCTTCIVRHPSCCGYLLGGYLGSSLPCTTYMGELRIRCWNARLDKVSANACVLLVGILLEGPEGAGGQREYTCRVQILCTQRSRGSGFAEQGPRPP